MILDAPHHSEIHGMYLRIMEKVCDAYRPVRTLKTDCWNEAHSQYPLAMVHDSIECLEIDEDTIVKAITNFPTLKVTQGDIRNIPFGYSDFDVLVDFSTIDHIHDYPMALKEYGRVVKNGGRVIITTWTSGDSKDVTKDPDVYTLDPSGKYRQYYFDADEFREAILDTRCLHLHDSGVYPHFKAGSRRLHWYDCVVYK